MTVNDYSLIPTRVLGAVATETGAVYHHLAKEHGDKVHVIFTPQPRIGEMLKILEEIPTAKLGSVTVIPAPADLIHSTTLAEWIRGGTPTDAAQAIKTAQIEDMRADGSTYWTTRANYMDSQDAQELYGEWTAQTFDALEGGARPLARRGHTPHPRRQHHPSATPGPLRRSGARAPILTDTHYRSSRCTQRRAAQTSVGRKHRTHHNRPMGAGHPTGQPLGAYPARRGRPGATRTPASRSGGSRGEQSHSGNTHLHQ